MSRSGHYLLTKLIEPLSISKQITNDKDLQRFIIIHIWVLLLQIFENIQKLLIFRIDEFDDRISILLLYLRLYKLDFMKLFIEMDSGIIDSIF